MASRWTAALALAALLLAPNLAQALDAARIVYVTRHAEKAAEGKDPGLTAQGQARARALAVMLGKAGIAHVFSTATMRTTQTAQPLAAQVDVPVTFYDAGTLDLVVRQIKALPGATLLVGHSNTVPELVKLLGGAAGTPLGEDEFDRLYQVIIAPDGSVTTVLLTTLAPP